ncbi:transposase [Microtetraspora malaysiensis]|uniref:transposase n=1 Tax=Microtetraspora malaysiensis TaxID=161358 RepID=UPI003D91DEDB
MFGDPPSDSTVRRTLELADPALLGRIAKARAKVRAHVWKLIEATEAGFPWLTVEGKTLTGWVVIDLDATIVLAHSNKEGAAATFKKTWGFHPLAAWCANTQESLAMLLRRGSGLKVGPAEESAHSPAATRHRVCPIRRPGSSH